MSEKEVMFEVNIWLFRDGTVRMERKGNVAVDKVIALGMLDVAKAMVIDELKPGLNPDAR